LDALPNITVNANSGSQVVNLTGISSGATNEIQTLSITATSSNPGLLANPVVIYSTPNATGSLVLTPLSNAFGSATITVTVNDGQGGTSTTYASEITAWVKANFTARTVGSATVYARAPEGASVRNRCCE
jgi:hypothetical protein